MRFSTWQAPPARWVIWNIPLRLYWSIAREHTRCSSRQRSRMRCFWFPQRPRPTAIHLSIRNARSTGAMSRPHTAGEVFNLGNTEEHSVLEYAQTIIRLCEATSTIIFEPNRVDDPERRRPDISKAQRVLEWTPKIGIESGLRRTIEWFSNTLSQPSSIS